MASYYITNIPQSRGEHEVHTSDCSHKPRMELLDPVGYFDSLDDAVKQAQKYFENVDTCYCCTRDH